MIAYIGPYNPPLAPPTRTIGDVYLDGLYLRFECFGCGRRVAIWPQAMSGFPTTRLRRLQEKVCCARCGGICCELAEVVWCPELDLKEAAE